MSYENHSSESLLKSNKNLRRMPNLAGKNKACLQVTSHSLLLSFCSNSCKSMPRTPSPRRPAASYRDLDRPRSRSPPPSRTRSPPRGSRRDRDKDRDRRSRSPPDRRRSHGKRRGSRSRSKSPYTRDRHERDRDHDRDKEKGREYARDRDRDYGREARPSDRDRDRHRRLSHRSFSRSPSRTRSDKPSTSPPKNSHNPSDIIPMDIPDEDEDDEARMKRLMGFGDFNSTKGKKVVGTDVSGANIKRPKVYRQYMNRRGGFNRPLDKVP